MACNAAQISILWLRQMLNYASEAHMILGRVAEFLAANTQAV
jgi:hypothetical protein